MEFAWRNNAFEPVHPVKVKDFLESNSNQVVLSFEKDSSIIHFNIYQVYSDDSSEDKIIHSFAGSELTFRLYESLGTFELFGWLDERMDA